MQSEFVGRVGREGEKLFECSNGSVVDAKFRAVILKSMTIIALIRYGTHYDHRTIDCPIICRLTVMTQLNRYEKKMKYK